MQNYPSNSEFTYQVVDQDGVEYLTFTAIGPEIVTINKIKIPTIRVECDELNLTLNLSINDNYQPIKIQKLNGKTQFTMNLIEFTS